MAVFGALSNGDFTSMVGSRLFLPESWSNNDWRCQEAGITKEDRFFKPKWGIAVDIINHQKELGIDFDYVGGDGYYGNSTELAGAIENMGFIYCCPHVILSGGLFSSYTGRCRKTI